MTAQCYYANMNFIKMNLINSYRETRKNRQSVVPIQYAYTAVNDDCNYFAALALLGLIKFCKFNWLLFAYFRLMNQTETKELFAITHNFDSTELKLLLFDSKVFLINCL